jgi:pimeloyl-ACP methyl ester carboxylesterase
VKRSALISAGVAAGALAAGAIGGMAVKRRHEHVADQIRWELPPQDLGEIESFDGTRISVHASGPSEAPVLLFVHGFSLDGTTWFEQWMDLSTEFRCVVMDQRGHGRSGPAAHGDLSMRSMGRDIAAVLDVVSPERPAVLVGHSMGAMAILAMAEQRPEMLGPRVAGVVLVGAASSDLLAGAMGSVTELLRPRLGSIGAAARRVDRLRKAVLASPADVRGAVVRLTQFGPDPSQAMVDHIVLLAQQASSEVWTQGLTALMETDLRPALSRVTVPALVVVGEHDRVTPPGSAVGLAGALPDGRLAVLEGAGHMAMLERPVELDREIRSFAHKVLTPEHAHAPRRRSKKAPQGEPEGEV